MPATITVNEAQLRRIIREEVERAGRPHSAVLWWRPTKLARHLGVSRHVIYKRIKSGKLQTRMAGGVREVRYP